MFKIFSTCICWINIYKMQRLEVSGAVRPIYGSLGVKRLTQFFLIKLQQLKNTKWNSFLRTLHPQEPSFWKITRCFTTPKQTIPPFLRNGTHIFRSSEKAKELARQFERSHNLTLHMSTPHHHILNIWHHKLLYSITKPTKKNKKSY
jgi:hypothetical protein